MDLVENARSELDHLRQAAMARKVAEDLYQPLIPDWSREIADALQQLQIARTPIREWTGTLWKNLGTGWVIYGREGSGARGADVHWALGGGGRWWWKASYTDLPDAAVDRNAEYTFNQRDLGPDHDLIVRRIVTEALRKQRIRAAWRIGEIQSPHHVWVNEPEPPNFDWVY